MRGKRAKKAAKEWEQGPTAQSLNKIASVYQTPLIYFNIVWERSTSYSLSSNSLLDIGHCQRSLNSERCSDACIQRQPATRTRSSVHRAEEIVLRFVLLYVIAYTHIPLKSIHYCASTRNFVVQHSLLRAVRRQYMTKNVVDNLKLSTLNYQRDFS